MLASTFCAAVASGRDVAGTESGERQEGCDESEGTACTASMRRGMVSAANISPVPEKKRGSWGVSMRKRRGLKSDVAVEPIMVRFSMSSRLTCGAWGWSDEEGVGHVDGCEVAASRCWASDGVCVPEPEVDAGLEGAREEMVWLSRVSRREVMMT